MPDGSRILTHAPNPDSPAIDAGDPVYTTSNFPVVNGITLTTDQRGTGFDRVVDIPGNSGGPIDIGAFEWQLDDEICDADFDNDGDVDGRDFLIWQRGFGSGTTNEDGDADFDGDVDSEDLACWQEHYGLGFASALTGDFDEDDDVDADDYASLLENFGMTSGATLADGDADGDGDVDESDFISWQVDYADYLGNDDWIDNALNFDPDDLANHQIIVTNPNDDNDNNYSIGDLSLREALALAALTGGSEPDVIVFANYAYASGSLPLLEGQLNVTTDVEIIGPGSDLLTIDAGDSSRIFSTTTGSDLTLSGVALANGQSSSGGGAIYNKANLTINSVVFLGNHANTNGGAIYSESGSGVVSIDSSTFAANTADNQGGALDGYFTSLVVSDSTFTGNSAGSGYNGNAIRLRSAPTAKLLNCTVSGNNGSNFGAVAVTNSSNLEIVNSTIAYNSVAAGTAGIRNISSGTVTVHNSIVAHNTAGTSTTPDLSGSIGSSSSHNLFSQSVAGLNSTNQTGVADAKLAPLGNYGGPTQTHALLVGSPAIDKGSTTKAGDYSLSADQRGRNRTVDISGVTNGADGYTDIGAYETGNDFDLVVTTLTDENDTTFNASDLSLREAIAFAENLAGTAIISFDESLYASGLATVTLSYDGSDPGSDVDSLVIDDAVTISGPRADLLKLDGNNQTRVLNVSSDSDVIIDGLTIAHGNVGSGFGGGIYSEGNLTLNAIAVEDSVAAKGGGIYQSGGSLSINASTISGNDATQGGGLFSNMVDLQVVNSTISGNSAATQGGGIYLYHQDATDPRLVNVTVTLNTVGTGGSGGGVFVYSPVNPRMSLFNSIVAGNSMSGGSANDVNGEFKSDSSHNLIGAIDNSLGLTGNGTLYGIAMIPYEAELDELDYYGGPTRTHRLLSTSDARDAGDDYFATTYDLNFDQRGLERIIGEGVDIGAVELAFDEL